MELSKSAIARHVYDNNHIFLFDQAKIICTAHSTAELDPLEAYFIFNNQTYLVNDATSTPFLSKVWQQLIQNISSMYPATNNPPT